MRSNTGAVLILSSLATSVHVATAQTAGDAVVVRPGDTLVDPGRLVPHRATWRVTRRDPAGGGTVQGLWTDTWARSIEFTSEAREGEVVYVAETVDREGRPARRRMTLTRRGPDEVRQRSEISYDDGATWSEEYDFTYIRKQE